MRVTEGPQAYLSHVRINGNTRLYENVVRRELRTTPGDLFSKDALMRSARELASMGHFDAETVSYTHLTEVLYNPSYEVLFNEETKEGLEGFEVGQETELGAVNVMTGIYTCLLYTSYLA